MDLVKGQLMPKVPGGTNRQKFSDSESRSIFTSFGDPRKVLSDLDMLEKSTRLLSSKPKVEQMRMDYADQWVCLYDGRVAVSAGTLHELLNKMDEQNVPREASHTEFMARKPISLLL